jgi:tetratricopeptide (TPR) repeat protein
MSNDTSRALPYPDPAYLDAAIGWFFLGLPDESLRELERMHAASRRNPDVLELEWALRARLGDWILARTVAEALLQEAPERPFGWIHLAYCLRRVPEGGLESAWNLLRPAFERFPKEKIIPYNLACYAAQMGRLDEAWEWFLTAIDVAGGPDELKALALADADLEPLRGRIAGI